jgi:hypothetical protein
MPDPVTPATAVPATPAAAEPVAPVVAAPAAAAPVVSLLDTPAAVAAPVADPAAPAADPAAAAAPEWFYANGVKGVGPVPEWYNVEKYRTVDEQAKAQRELEKRFGAFTGAPKDGKYEFKMPEGIEGEFDTTSEIYIGFNKWAVDNQLNPKGYQDLLGMFAQYEASQAPQPPDMNAIKAELGENADARITAAAQWAKANLDAGTFETFREATAGANAAAVFKVIEAAINKTRQVSLPAPGADVPGAQPTQTTDAIIQARMNEKLTNGKIRYFEDAEFRRETERMRTELFARNAA